MQHPVQPLTDVRVLDLTNLLPGPYATQFLADLGADVIKIEHPAGGDGFRQWDSYLEDELSHTFLQLNRRKRSVTLDLKTEEGQEIFYDLAEQADVVIEGFRPGVVDRLGIDYDRIREHNDSIVYCSLSGYGQDSPYVDWPGHDLNYIAIAGMLAMTGDPDEPPVMPGITIADYAGGMLAAFAIATGLRWASYAEESIYFDVSMTDVIISWISLYLPQSNAGERPHRGHTLQTNRYPSYAVYETADGKHITLGAVEYKFWEQFCIEAGLEEYANREDQFPEGERNEEIRTALQETFGQYSLDEWMERLDPTEIPIAPVNTVDDVWEDPHVEQRELITTVKVGGEEVPVARTPLQPVGVGQDATSEAVSRTGDGRYPELGEDTDSVLREIGYDDETIAQLREDGVFSSE